MLKKLLSIMTAVLMLTSCIGADTIFADEDIVSEIFTIEDKVVSFEQPDAVDPTGVHDPENPDDDSWWVKTDADGNNLTYYVAKFDLSGYVLPVKSADFKIAFRNNGYGNVNVYAVRGDWNAGELNYNSLLTLAGGSLANSKSIEWHHALADYPQPAYPTTAVNLTTQVNEVINDTSSADKFLTVVVARAKASSVLRVQDNSAMLTITQSEPAYNVPAGQNAVTCSEHGLINANNKDASTTSTNQYSTINQIMNDPYGVGHAVYVKFDLSSIAGEIETATLSFKHGSLRGWTYRAYGVENDAWKQSTLTFNTAYGVEADEANGIAAVEAQFTPTEAGYSEFKGASTAHPNTMTDVTGDVTELVKSLSANDNLVSLAIMPFNVDAANNKALNVQVGSATLTLTTKASTVTAGVPVFKVDGTEADTLSSGVISAEVEITSTMSAPTTTTMIMAVYDNDELVKLYISKPQKINEKSINNGITNLTITSNEEITVGDNARASVFMWKDISIPSPLGTVKTIATK